MHNPSKTLKDKHLVMWSTKSSISRSQLSILALFEIPIAIFLAWYIDRLLPLPLLMMSSTMAVPLLLLRSPKSKRVTRVMARRYLMLNRKLSGWCIAIAVGITLLFFWAEINFLDYVLPSQSKLFSFFIGVLSGIVNAVAIISFSIASQSMALGMAAFGGAIGLSLAYAFVYGYGLAIGLIGSEFIIFIYIANFGERELLMQSFLIGPSFAIGGYLHFTCIKIYATMSNLHEGLAYFSSNFRESVGVIDIKATPEIFQDCGTKRQSYIVKDLLAANIKATSNYDRIMYTTFKFFTVSLFYCFALIYRLNIKASIWIWGPTALALRRRNWLDDEEMRSTTAYWSTSVIQSSLFSITAMFAIWLSLPFAPPPFHSLVPSWIESLYVHYPPPPISIRYALIWGTVISLLGLIHSAYCIRAQHKKILESPVELNGYDDNLKNRVRKIANSVQYWLQWTTALFIFSVWSITLVWAHNRFPGEFQSASWGLVLKVL